MERISHADRYLCLPEGTSTRTRSSSPSCFAGEPWTARECDSTPSTGTGGAWVTRRGASALTLHACATKLAMAEGRLRRAPPPSKHAWSLSLSGART